MREISQYKIKGAEVKRAKNGCLIVGFSSKFILDEQLLELKNINERFFLVFYGSNLSSSNLNILLSLDVAEVGVFHSSFCDADLVKLSQSMSLELVKLHDTLVTQSCIDEIKRLKPELKIFA
jgi:hypothetical protein